MAVVYHAYDRVGERDVALKFLPPTEDEQLKKRFQREAIDLAAVFHPNIVDFYALGESQGFEFIEMEYVDGGNLASFARDCESLRDLLQVFVKICDGLEHMHRCGVVHRDVKPANILMTRNGQPKISDMGLARREEGRSQLTQDGALLGTPSYLAPEQLMSHAVGPSADLYALGVCLFEAVTCRHPFDAVGPLAMLRAHLDQTPPTPSSVVPGLPERLDRLILAMMEKDSIHRPASAAAVAQELSVCLAELTPAQELLVASSAEGLLNRARLMLDAGHVEEAGRLLTEAEAQGGDQELKLRIATARSKIKLLAGHPEAVTSAQNLVAACRAGHIKLLGEALLVLGQAATAEERWEEALLALQEARDLIPSSQRELQVGLMDSLATLHEKGASVGHPSLSRDESSRFREIAQGLARRGESVSQSPSTLPPLGPVPIPASSQPSPSRDTAASLAASGATHTVTTPPAPAASRRVTIAVVTVLGLFLLTAMAYRAWPEKPAVLEVVAEPQGAVVLIDGARFTSPHKGDLKAGVHKVKVFAQGFKAHEESVTLEPGQTMKLKANLEPASGSIKVASTPLGAKLFVNGQARGKTPVALEGLPPKKLQVKLVKEGYKHYEGTVEVQAGKTKNLTFAMVKLPPPPPPAPRWQPAPAASSWSGGGGGGGRSSSSSSSSRPAPRYDPPPQRSYSLPVNIPSRVEFRAPRVKVRFP
jgi:hypothetical protein